MKRWYEVTDLPQLQQTCQTFEAALRGEQGILFEEDGYEVNIADLRAKLDEAEKRLRGYESWERSVNEALNTGDGSYRP